MNTIVCLLNNRWKENEMQYLFSLLLNTLHYLGWKDFNNFNDNVVELKIKIDNRISELKQDPANLNKIWKYFTERFVLHL